MLKPLVTLLSVIFICILLIPAIVVQFVPQSEGQAQVFEELVELEEPDSVHAPVINISVYRTAQDKIEKLSLEKYIKGVVAAEMPTDFEIEALKAQALAARTYIIRRIMDKDFSDVPEGAVVSDTIQHQVYLSDTELRERWGRDYEKNMSKITKAVNETMGQVLTYEGKPITATFFSTSNGFTENSEEYWSAEVSYLRSVASPWDTASPRFEEVVKMNLQDFQQKLGLQLAQPVSTEEQPFIEIISRTAGNRVKEAKVGEHTFSGKELRERLDISSSHFEIKLEGEEVIISTKGWGHGVGMSQWGANGMAKEGYLAEDIVKYYYTGIDIQDYREWIVHR